MVSPQPGQRVTEISMLSPEPQEPEPSYIAFGANAEQRRNEMTLCPIAILAGCKRCPALTFCPLKGLIGNYRKQEEAQTKQQADEADRDEKKAE